MCVRCWRARAGKEVVARNVEERYKAKNAWTFPQATPGDNLRGLQLGLNNLDKSFGKEGGPRSQTRDQCKMEDGWMSSRIESKRVESRQDRTRQDKTGQDEADKMTTTSRKHVREKGEGDRSTDKTRPNCRWPQKQTHLRVAVQWCVCRPRSITIKLYAPWMESMQSKSSPSVGPSDGQSVSQPALARSQSQGQRRPETRRISHAIPFRVEHSRFLSNVLYVVRTVCIWVWAWHGYAMACMAMDLPFSRIHSRGPDRGRDRPDGLRGQEKAGVA